MARIESGVVVAFFLFDVAESIRLDAVRTAVGSAARDTRITTKLAAPSHVQYTPPPISLSGAHVGIREVQGFAASFKVYEYGVISVALTLDFSGTWTELTGFTSGVMGSDQLEAGARHACQKLVEQIKSAATGLRDTYLSEDYHVMAVRRLNPPLDTAGLLRERGDEIARLLRNERKPLSAEERDEVLRHRLSYLADDVFIVTWQAAFVYDPDDIQAALEIIEFANSQLLQFRYYDDLLDTQLTAVYAQIEQKRWYDTLIGGRYTKAAHRLHSLFIDVNEVTDRTENALKAIGDMYTARLFQLAARRIGVDTWKQAVEEKLRTLDVVYRSIVEEVNMRRGHFLELTVVLILLFELALFFMGIMT